VNAGEKRKLTRAQIFEQIEDAAWAADDAENTRRARRKSLPTVQAGAAIPHMNEPWYCCAEPTGDQLASIAGARATGEEADAFV